ncbi:MAG TPA: type II toxin-antitoxin system VapC family toxin [Fibrobacteraceae bacterium]|nr:type II toxin-antitoxin system VapC family toxin [Fibrobacteraceae bacterium]
MNALVFDTTIALGLCFEDRIDATVLQTVETLRSRDALVPAHWRLQVGQQLLEAERHRRISATDRSQFLQLLDALLPLVDSETSAQAWLRTWQLAQEHSLNLEDAAYLELAQRYNVPLASCNKELVRAATKIGLPSLPG